MDLDQENLNLIEEVIELTEEINYDDLVIEEEGLENECEEDNDYSMFLLDESAPKAAKAIFESPNLQYIQSENENEDVESDDESCMLIDSDNEEDLVIPNTLPIKLSQCVIVDNSKGEHLNRILHQDIYKTEPQSKIGSVRISRFQFIYLYKYFNFNTLVASYA